MTAERTSPSGEWGTSELRRIVVEVPPVPIILPFHEPAIDLHHRGQCFVGTCVRRHHPLWAGPALQCEKHGHRASQWHAKVRTPILHACLQIAASCWCSPLGRSGSIRSELDQGGILVPMTAREHGCDMSDLIPGHDPRAEEREMDRKVRIVQQASRACITDTCTQPHICLSVVRSALKLSQLHLSAVLCMYLIVCAGDG